MAVLTLPRVAPRLRPASARRTELVVHGAIFALLVVVAFFPAVVASHDPFELVGIPFEAPGPVHWFGTDEIGRDLFSRVVHGLPISLASAALAVVVAFALGLLVGIPAGLTRDSWLDRTLGGLTETAIAIPSVLLTLAIITTFGRGTLIAAVAIGIGEAPGFARLVRGCVIKVSALTFVEAARAGGARTPRIIVRHVIPAILPPLVSFTALQFGVAMLAIGAISYLGFGEAPPSPEWGVLIASGQKYIVHAWWVALIPGVVLSAVVILLNRAAYLLQGEKS
ncbi:ABC transporter permease [Microbacterium ulmi]|uniref:ABC transporter permease n=1 Tax=Microbacterium ulmi TaxID=179095 RepID=A0A7Y2M1I8_9MICO|nr:ABC transporter permease [Microbacterium ulmi]NII69297.1 peptide/nickel transport system permease protein [Microbacterium ulmi]NNH04089.1 ABC transporter permease [Microbacterium ulmi]